MILAIRTDRPTAELYLLDPAGKVVAQHEWLADRQLADTLLETILSFLDQYNHTIEQVSGVAVFTGEGSFTGLRIGTTVANALAYSLGMKVAAIGGKNWLAQIAPTLAQTKLGQYAIPIYDSEPNINQKKQAYRLIILAPSAGGKSTLLRYFRKNTSLNVKEMDEEVLKLNKDKWPEDNKYKDKILVPKIVDDILHENEVIYLASYVPRNYLKKARMLGFKVGLINLDLGELARRNTQRMLSESYADATPWLQLQLDTFTSIDKDGLIDFHIDGKRPVEDISKQILACIKR